MENICIQREEYVNATDSRFHCHSRKFNIFIFLALVEAKRGVKFRQVTCNAGRIQRKVENENFVTLGPQVCSTNSAMCGIQREEKKCM